jgi:hypothetical protein
MSESTYRTPDDENDPPVQDPVADHGDSDADSTVTGTTPTEGGGDAAGGTGGTPSTGVQGTTPTEGGG